MLTRFMLYDRMNCYKELTSALEYLYHKQSSARNDNVTPTSVTASFSTSSVSVAQDQMRVSRIPKKLIMFEDYSKFNLAIDV